MEKTYTNKDYADKAVEANKLGQQLYIYIHDVEIEPSENEQSQTKNIAELVIAPYGYYVCYQDNYTNGTINENFDAEQLAKAKEAKNTENITKAKAAVENGYVTFKNAEFETNAQTVGDLTATMLMMQASGLETYTWLSKDDKAVELTVEDFGTLGGLIAQFKNTVWNDKYLTYKAAIKKAKTLAAVEKVVIDYDNTDSNE